MAYATLIYSFRLWHQSKFYLPATRTARFSNSFIVYGLNNYL